VEQAHRFVKRRVNFGSGFGTFSTAQQTIQGYEAMPMPRKGQIEGSPSGISSHKTVPSTSRSEWWPKESSPSLSLHSFQFLQHIWTRRRCQGAVEPTPESGQRLAAIRPLLDGR
jgi:hypothetical protein